MSRLLALLFLVSASAIAAAPAPKPKPMPTGPWFDGWGEPVDKQKDCRFDRKGGKLTVTVPGKGHKLDIARDGGGFKLGADSAAPMLLRELEGDFAVRFRVAGAVTAPLGRAREAFTTGLVLLDGNKIVIYLLSYPVNKKPMYLQVERRGHGIHEVELGRGDVGGRKQPAGRCIEEAEAGDRDQLGRRRRFQGRVRQTRNRGRQSIQVTVGWSKWRLPGRAQRRVAEGSEEAGRGVIARSPHRAGRLPPGTLSGSGDTPAGIRVAQWPAPRVPGTSRRRGTDRTSALPR